MNKSLLGILLTNFVIYSIIIFIFPNFMGDDYIIFHLIKENSSYPTSFNPSEYFFLFLRPLSYFTFWFDYNIWHSSAIGMKFFSLIIHLGLIWIIYEIVVKISVIMKKQLNEKILFVCLTIFSIHPVVLAWISWISNRTELLYLFFYSTSLLFFFKYLIQNKKIYLFYIVIFYIASILSKQQGLHLPLLFVFIHHYLKTKSDNPLPREFYFTIGLLLILMIGISILNYSLNIFELSLIENWYKKPFSLLGNLLHTALPLFSQCIYNYFLLNKLTALIGGLLLFSTFLFQIFRNRNLVFRLLPFFILLIIVSYPRFLAVGNQRLNGIYLLYLTLGVYFLLLNKRYYYVRVTLMSLTILFCYTFISTVYTQNKEISNFNDQMIGLKNISLQQKETKLIVIAAENSFFFPFFINFLKKEDFGYDTTIGILPIFVDKSLVPFNGEQLDRRNVNVVLNSDVFTVKTTEKLISLSLDRKNPCVNDIVISEKRKSQTDRGYDIIKFKFIKTKSGKMIYHDGKAWVDVK